MSIGTENANIAIVNNFPANPLNTKETIVKNVMKIIIYPHIQKCYPSTFDTFI